MILVIGDILTDIFVSLAAGGDHAEGDVAIRAGGSAANTAAWCAVRGETVRFVGCVGNDAAGTMLEEHLAGLGVGAELRRVEGMETGAMLAEPRGTGSRLLRASRGANRALAPDDILRAGDRSVTAVHLTGYAFVGPYGTALIEAAAQVARRAGAILSFDPSSTGVIRGAGGPKLLQTLKRLGVDVLLPNLAEARALTGETETAPELAEPESGTRRIEEALTDAEIAAAKLALDIPWAFVTAGAAGAAGCRGGDEVLLRVDAVDAVETTGAGDAFNAGVLTALLAGNDLEGCCRAGHAQALQVLGSLGGSPPYAARR